MRQVSEWLALYAAEPWGYEAADTRNALLAFITATSHGAKNLKLENFRLRPSAHEDDEDDEYRLAKQIRAAFGIPSVR